MIMTNIISRTIARSLLPVVCLALFSCEADKQPVALETFQFVKPGTPADTLDIDEILPITITATPENTTEKIIWSSADPEIAQVQSNDPGLVAGVIGLKVGNTLISASTFDGRFSQSFPVEVIIKVKRITFSDEMILQSPGAGRFNVLFDPENATIRDLLWSSGNPEVAGIDPVTGFITALSPGSSVITATTKQGGKSATTELFVSGEPPVFGKDYCTITATNAKGGDYSADRISTSGAVRDLSHFDTSLPTGSYKYYAEEELIIKKGETFTLNLEQSNDWSRTLVWIDWNGDKDFGDERELVAVFGNYYIDSGSNPGPFSKLITVPDNAIPGFARMRVITGDAWTLDFDIQEVEPCGTTAYGNTKDFPVEIRN
jgi:hypothetical protein